MGQKRPSEQSLARWCQWRTRNTVGPIVCRQCTFHRREEGSLQPCQDASARAQGQKSKYALTETRTDSTKPDRFRMRCAERQALQRIHFTLPLLQPSWVPRPQLQDATPANVALSPKNILQNPRPDQKPCITTLVRKRPLAAFCTAEPRTHVGTRAHSHATLCKGSN